MYILEERHLWYLCFGWTMVVITLEYVTTTTKTAASFLLVCFRTTSLTISHLVYL